MSKVNIIITTRDILPHTKLCLRSIRECTNYPHRIIAVDDTSKDGTVDYLKKQSDVILIENKTGKAHGMYVGLQRGMDLAYSDYYVFAERDDLFTPNWLTKLVELMEKDESIGMIQSMSNGGGPDASLPQGGITDLENPVQKYWQHRNPKTSDPRFANTRKWTPMTLTYDEVQEYGKFIEEYYWRLYRYVELIWFGHCIVSQECITQVPLDTRFFRGEGDNEWCLRAIREGWKLACRMDTYTHVQNSATFATEAGWGTTSDKGDTEFDNDVRLIKKMYPKGVTFQPCGPPTPIPD